MRKVKKLQEAGILNLKAIAEEISRDLSARDMAREKILRLSREVIRYSSNAIRAVHRAEKGEAENALNSASAFLNEAVQILADHSALLHVALIHDAQKEFAEARITMALVDNLPLPSPGELGVSYTAYLNGMGEAVGEMRRYILDSLRRGDFSRSEEILMMMDEIYSVLVTMDFPDAITGGLRRTTDVTRGILEKTRGDLTLALMHKETERRLEAFH